MKVVVDAFGGDNAPVEIVKGAALALQRNKDISIVLCGDEIILNDLIKKFNCDISRVEILPSSEVISNNEAPVEAIRNKKNSSIVKGFERLKTDNECIGFVSAGSTGAVLTGAFLKIGRIKGIHRPALAPLFPTITGGNVLIIDCGANMDTDENNLVQFAIMGTAYMQAAFNIEKPRVALLSVGVEDKKGNELTKGAFKLLKAMPEINFVGNMEARDAMSGDYDIIVCDGFAGNVLTKSIEGTAGVIMKSLKNEIKSSLLNKIGAVFMIKAFKSLKKTFDHNKYGGAPFLGVKKPIIKSHGSSKALSIAISIEQVKNLHIKNLNQKIEKSLSEFDSLGDNNE